MTEVMVKRIHAAENRLTYLCILPHAHHHLFPPQVLPSLTGQALVIEKEVGKEDDIVEAMRGKGPYNLAVRTCFSPPSTCNFDQLARRFLENQGEKGELELGIFLWYIMLILWGADAQTRLQIVTEIRDNIEVVHSPEYTNFLNFMFPVFYNVLRQGT